MKKKHKQPEGFKPGIYFGMPEAAYHADPALSHSGMVKLLLSELDYWVESPLNPDRETWREAKRGSAMWFGKMSHLLLLERERFWRDFRIIGQTPKDGVTWLTKDEYREIKAAVDEIKAVPEAAAHFEKGYPEVSIFWRDPATGLMLRARCDYLRTFGAIDYKRARSLQNNQLGWHIADFGYDIQHAHYVEGIRQIKAQLNSGKAIVDGPVAPEWIEEFKRDTDVMFRFFFQRSDSPYIFRIIKGFDEEIASNARQRIDEAKERYRYNIERYGTARWPAGKVEAEEFSIYHLPKRIFDN